MHSLEYKEDVIMRHISPMFFMGIVTSYCQIFSVPWEQLQKEIELPKMNQSIPQLQLTSILQKIQLRWVEAVTGRLWDGQDFYQLWWDVSSWLAEGAEDCPEDQPYEVWAGQMWKRGAESVLGLTAKED